MATLSAYISPYDYLRSPTGLESATLLGNLTRLATTLAAGAVTLPLATPLTVALNQYDPITFFDANNSEVVLVGFGGAAVGASSVPVSATTVAHAIGTPLASPGVLGSLPDEILKASSWLENITKQSLWSTTQTETLRIPTLRASFDNQNILTFRTKQYPITAINSLSIGATQGNFVSYDPTQCFIDSNELVTVPVLQGTGSGSSTWPLMPCQMNRRANGYLQVNYSAGYTTDTMPRDIVDACILLVSALLARRDNPAGFLDLREGQGSATAAMRGDTSGDSILIKEAKYILSQYTLRMF